LNIKKFSCTLPGSLAACFGPCAGKEILLMKIVGRLNLIGLVKATKYQSARAARRWGGGGG
jgi:hypothetical protein